MRSFIHFAQPLFGKEEKKEVLAALDSGWVTLGPRTKQFEEDFAKYVGAKHAIAVSSCTAGLHLSLIAAGVGPGDEVITTPFTFVATTNTIIHVGASPVFVDIDPRTFNIDPSKIEEKITPKTKAIVPVHYGGQPVDMDAILAIAKKHNLIVIEDGAHAAGTEYKGKRIGSFGDMTNFSFHPVKNMSTGDGGMITTNNDAYAEKLMNLRLHGMSKDAWKRHSASGSWRYDIAMPGFKYNMTDIAAALGIHQLKKLDMFTTVRDTYVQMYNEIFKDTSEITTPFVMDDIRHVWSLYTIMIDASNLKISRDELVEELKAANIGTSVYFIPIHYFTYYKQQFKYEKGDFPITEDVFEKIISLPLYPKMSKQDVIYVGETIRTIIEKNRKEYSWSIDKFDTDIFDMNVAKIKHIYANGDTQKLHKTITALQKDLKKHEIEYAIYRVPAENYTLVQALEDKDFMMVDGLISLTTNLEEKDYEVDSFIQKASKEDLTQLKQLASTAFDKTRVYNDTALDKRKAGKLYATWIENSVNKQAADEVLVWKEHNEVLGFITLQKNGHIPLLAVAQKARGKGIAKSLIKAGLQQIKGWGIGKSEIETQMVNIAALRTYQACGFKINNSYLTFRWRV